MVPEGLRGKERVERREPRVELWRPWPEGQEPLKWTVRGQAKRQKESLESAGPLSPERGGFRKEAAAKRAWRLSW